MIEIPVTYVWTARVFANVYGLTKHDNYDRCAMAGADIKFNLNNTMTIIKAKPDDPFQLIIEQYIQKTSIEPNSFHFIANSKEIEPKQTVESHMSDIDIQNNKIAVLVNYVNEEE